MAWVGTDDSNDTFSFDNFAVLADATNRGSNFHSGSITLRGTNEKRIVIQTTKARFNDFLKDYHKSFKMLNLRQFFPALKKCENRDYIEGKCLIQREFLRQIKPFLKFLFFKKWQLRREKVWQDPLTLSPPPKITSHPRDLGFYRHSSIVFKAIHHR